MNRSRYNLVHGGDDEKSDKKDEKSRGDVERYETVCAQILNRHIKKTFGVCMDVKMETSFGEINVANDEEDEFIRVVDKYTAKWTPRPARCCKKDSKI